MFFRRVLGWFFYYLLVLFSYFHGFAGFGELSRYGWGDFGYDLGYFCSYRLRCISFSLSRSLAADEFLFGVGFARLRRFGGHGGYGGGVRFALLLLGGLARDRPTIFLWVVARVGRLVYR